MLPGSYTFAMTYLGTRRQVTQDVSVSPLVVFQTVVVHSQSGLVHSYYAGSWRPFTQDMELLPGTYTFALTGQPSVTRTLVPGQTNLID